jgi:hypothetical protein
MSKITSETAQRQDEVTWQRLEKLRQLKREIMLAERQRDAYLMQADCASTVEGMQLWGREAATISRTLARLKRELNALSQDGQAVSILIGPAPNSASEPPPLGSKTTALSPSVGSLV